MKINKILSLVLGFTVIASSCTVNELPEQELPAGEFVRLTLSGGDGTTATPAQATRATWDDPNGSGKLAFMWEAVGLESEETAKLSFILSDGTKALSNQAAPEMGAPEDQLTHTGVAVTPNEQESRLADFETVRYYSTDDLNKADYIYAVAGYADVKADEEKKQHVCSLDMPSSFTQVENQNPNFLKDYMHMYAATEYNATSTRLQFKHIPATFRFIITNNTEDAMSFESVSVSVVGGGAVASETTDVIFGWESADAELTYGAAAYETVTTTLSDNTLQKGQKYTAYSMALPLASNEAFAGKVLSFSAKSSDGKNLTYLLEGETLANANGSGIYNWVGGKSYTIKLNIGEGGKTSGTLLSNKDITVVSTVGGEFTLKYVDAAGNPLADYADICTMTVDDMAIYEDFVDANVAPFEADAIGIFDEAGVKVGSIEISGIRADNSGLLYSVGMLSDVHLNTQNSYYSDSFTDFDNALKFFNAVNVAFTCTCGDITENGIEAEFARYQEIVAANPETQVYTTTGNHDATQSGIDEAIWKQYTGHGLVYEVSKTVNGQTDHFLFLGMSAWNFAEAYTSANLMWLKSRLEAYKNERCFIITHLFFPDGAGNMLNIYPEDNWLRGVQLNELKELAAKYVNTIWFSGHSHWKWSLQKFDDDANVYRNQNAGWTVHIPSCAKPSDSDGISSRDEKKDQSEGAVINVYENHIDVLGVDFISGKYIPVGTYRLDTTLEEVAETPLDETSLTAENFEVYKGEGMSITNVEGMPGYIDVIFTGKEQGYYVKNDTFATGYDSENQVFDLDIEYLQCWTGWGTTEQTEVTTIEDVGFYAGTYNLLSTKYCYVNSVRGVQFQTKSDCKADFPIKIRMKARGQFYLKDPNKPIDGIYLTAENFIDNEFKPGAEVENVADKPGYIDVIFDGPSQGFYMTNSTFTRGYDTNYQSVDIGIDDLQCWTSWGKPEQTEVSTISGVGFYSGNYNLKSTSSCYINHNLGVQFHTKSDCVGPYPIKIRMKASADFNLKSTAPSLYLSAANFSEYSGKTGASVKDVEGMPGYVDITIGQGQALHMKNFTLEEKRTNVDITIEYAKVIAEDGTESNVPQKVGFYGKSAGESNYGYHMQTNKTFITATETNGIPFQMSGSAPITSSQITIRMKAKAIFY